MNNLKDIMNALEVARLAISSTTSGSKGLIDDLDQARKALKIKAIHGFRQTKQKFSDQLLEMQKNFTELLHYAEMADINMEDVEKAWNRINKTRRDSELITMLNDKLNPKKEHSVAPKVEPIKEIE